MYLKIVTYMLLVLAPLLLSQCGSPLPKEASALKKTPTEPLAKLPTPSPENTSTLVTPMRTVEENTPTPQSDGILGGPLILQYSIGGDVFLQDLSTGEMRSLSPKIVIYNNPDFLGWTSSGCSFLYRDQNRDIAEVNLHGEKIRTVFSAAKFDHRVPLERVYRVLPSPTEKYVAFIMGEGDREKLIDHPDAGSHLRTEDLYTVSIRDGSVINQVSRGGGAWFYQWSPDGEAIVYTDYDSQGHFQLYVAQNNGENQTQISNYMEEDRALGILYWSPDSRFILRSSFYYPFNVDVIEIETKSILELKDLDHFWWEQDDTFATWTGGTIRWISPKNGKITREIANVEKLNSHVQAIGSNLEFGCFNNCFHQGYGKFESYDLSTLSLIEYPNAKNILDTQGWSVAPGTFSIETDCKK